MRGAFFGISYLALSILSLGISTSSPAVGRPILIPLRVSELVDAERLASDGTKILWNNSHFEKIEQRFEITGGSGPFNITATLIPLNPATPSSDLIVTSVGGNSRNLSVTPPVAGMIQITVTDTATAKIERTSIQVRGPQDRIAHENALNFDSLRNLIRQKNVASIEELLPLLPKSYRAQFTMMHTSASLQGSSYENPRVILYGKTARFIMTFNGYHAVGSENQGHGETRDPKINALFSLRRGFFELEILQFDPAKSQFELRFISFPRGQAFKSFPETPLQEVDTAYTSARGVQFSNPNPGTCLGCHNQNNPPDPRPLWLQYEVWPGAYGEVSDTWEPAKELREEIRPDRYDNVNFEIEQTKLNQLISRSKNHPRLRFLPLAKNYRRVADLASHPRYRSLPNITFTTRLYHNLTKRLMRKLTEKEKLLALRLNLNCSIPQLNAAQNTGYRGIFFLGGLKALNPSFNPSAYDAEFGIVLNQKENGKPIFKNERITEYDMGEFPVDVASPIIEERRFYGLQDGVSSEEAITYQLVSSLKDSSSLFPSVRDQQSFLDFLDQNGLKVGALEPDFARFYKHFSDFAYRRLEYNFENPDPYAEKDKICAKLAELSSRLR